MLIVALVLVAIILLIGVGYEGWTVYHNYQQHVRLTAERSERDAANQAIKQLQLTCLTYAYDNSHLFYSQAFGYSGEVIIYETFGIANPTAFSMHSTWTLKIDFTAVRLSLSSSLLFDLRANGTAYPRFSFVISALQYDNLPSNPDLSRYNITFDSNYVVTGTYGAYTLSQHSSYNSTTSPSTVEAGTKGNLPKC